MALFARKLKADTKEKQRYLKDLKGGQTKLTYAQWVRAKRAGGSKQFVRGQQMLSSEDYQAVQKLLRGK